MKIESDYTSNTMKPFIHEDFLLHSRSASELYHTYAHDKPVIDYHNHLNARQIADGTGWQNIAELWLGADHYKWRAMRAAGVSEDYITGKADDRQKFKVWAAVVPKLLRNPLYHWTHLELKRFFSIDELLSAENADRMYDRMNEIIQSSSFTPRSLLKQMNVSALCTTDDPLDNLAAHKKIKDSADSVKVLPTYRPDMVFKINEPDKWNTWINSLSLVCGSDINSFAGLTAALRERHNYFHEAGCRISDHGVETILFSEYTTIELERIFRNAKIGLIADEKDYSKFFTALMYEFSKMDAEKDWVQQIHIGPIRNLNHKMFLHLGADSGFDSIGDTSFARPLSALLNLLEQTGNLPKTILYNINPKDNEMLAALTCSFQGEGIRSKIQYGSGWWFLDQKDGITRQINALSNMGILSNFVGMLTDSRSFLSFTRHEYFRRILCDILGDEIEKGVLPEDIKLIGNMVEEICWRNAQAYFNL